MYTHCLDAPNYMYKWTKTMVKVRQDLACYIRIYAWHSTSDFVCKSLHIMYRILLHEIHPLNTYKIEI
jgi:hypothetical protein